MARVSRFNCNDCVRFETDACKFGATHRDYSDYCEEMLVEQDHAYNKAIDDFVEILKNQWTIDSILCATDKFKLGSIIKRQAEQLKGVNNE